MILSCWILIRIRNVSGKIVEKIKTQILCSVNFFLKSCHLWDNEGKKWQNQTGHRRQLTRRVRFACWITKATDTHWCYEILIAFPRQKWLRERAPISRYTNIACLVGLEKVMPDSYHIFVFCPLILPQNSVIRRVASDAPRNLAASYLRTYVRCATFGPTYKTVILIDCQFYGRVLR